MKQTFSILLFCAAFVAGCGKSPEPADANESEPAPHHDENIVALTEENLKHVDLKMEAAQISNLGQTLRTVGRVSLNSNNTAKVSTTFEGRVAKLNFDLNERVKSGDVVGLVETPELLGRPLELKAPIDGVIVERGATVGELLEKGQSVYTISDPNDAWVIAEVTERDIGQVKVGQQASFTVISYGPEKFHGTVALIGNEVEPQTRTVEVRIEVENRDARLKPGMFADIEITTAIQKALVVPDGAVQTDGESKIVFVALGENRFEKRVVETGEEKKSRVQILAGLKPGEKIVTDGSFILKSELLKGELGEE